MGVPEIEKIVHGPPKRIVLINPPVTVVDRVQLDYYADAIPFGLIQIAAWLQKEGHQVAIADMMTYGKHETGWDGLLKSGELRPSSPLPSGAREYLLDSWIYGHEMAWLDNWFDQYSDKPDEIWVTCTILFNSDLAHDVIAQCKKRFPNTIVRFGGGYPSLSPEAAKASAADSVHVGRIHEADLAKPELARYHQDQHYAIFRLTCGCPNHCAFCINGRDKMHKFPVDDVVQYIRETHHKLNIRHFNNWDPNVLRFRPHLKEFLKAVADADLDIELRFDMGFEPDLIDDELIDLLKAAKVAAFTIPLESVNPMFASFFEKPYTIISSIRALHRLTTRGFAVNLCHGTSVIGYPDEQLVDLFTLFHVVHHFGLLSTPFPITPLPNSPVAERYGSLLSGKPFSEYNGHLWPLLRNPAMIRLYRQLILILTASSPKIAENLIKRFPDQIQTAYFAGQKRAIRLTESVIMSNSTDTVDNLTRLYNTAARG